MKRTTFFAMLAAVAFILPLAGISAQLPPSPAARPASGDYRVGPGDILKVTVYRAPEYDSAVQIAADGTIAISVIGAVKVAGLTPAAIAAEIAKRLQDGGIFRNPVVNILVQEYRSRTVAVLGNVSKPGEFPLERGDLRISDLLARAGAVVGEGMGIVRLTDPNGKIDERRMVDVISGRSDGIASPGTTIFVSTPAIFYISGEVQRSGSYPIEPGLTVGRAIALAGGLTPRGSRKKVKITRLTNGAEERIPAKDDMPIQPKDLVMIGARIF